MAKKRSKLNKAVDQFGQTISDVIVPQQAEQQRKAAESVALQEQQRKAQEERQKTPIPQPPGTDGAIKGELTQPKVFRGEGGKLTGVELPGGKRLIGLKPEEIRDLVEKNRRDTELPQGAVDATEVLKTEEQQAMAQRLFSRVGEINPEIVEQLRISDPDLFQALSSGLAATVPGAIGGAITGAVGGAGVSALPGAVIGATGGFLAGTIANLRGQTAGEIQARGANAVTEREANMRALIQDTRNNPQNAGSNLMLFNEQLSLIDRDHSELKILTQQSLSKFLGKDGTPELARYEMFDSVGGSRELLIRDMQSALLSPSTPGLSFPTETEGNF